LYSEVKIIRNIGDSVVSFYAGESGIEKVLFYDRQALPLIPTRDFCPEDGCSSDQVCDNGYCANIAPRGLCSMFDPSNNHNYCAPGQSGEETSIYCNSFPGRPSLTGRDCSINSCTDCEISFSTTFDKRTYYTIATVSPSEDSTKEDPDYEIISKGIFGDAQRQIKINIISTK
jgi:hypothetical protein